MKKRVDFASKLLVEVLSGNHHARTDLWRILTGEDLNATPKPTSQHGTRGGYVRHFKVGEKPCAECRGAHAAYRRRRKAS